MNRQVNEMYTKEAERISASANPRSELLELARFVVEDRRRRQRRSFLAAAAVAVVGAPLAMWGLGAWRDEPATDDAATTPADLDASQTPVDEFDSEMAWLAEVRDRPIAQPLTEEETNRVLDAFMSPLPEARRRALRISIERTIHVPDGHLLWFLSNNDASDDSIALSLAWHNCARNKSFSSTELLEPFAIDGEEACRIYALRALGEVRDYTPPVRLVASLEGAPSAVVAAASNLLKKAGS